MNWRPLLLAGLAILVLTAAALGGWLLTRRAPAQILTLPNGVQYRFAGVTYGTNHVMSSQWSAVLRKLPGPFDRLALKLVGTQVGQQRTHTSAQPSLVAWFEPLGTNVGPGLPPVSLQALLANDEGVMSGEREHLTFWTGTASPPWVMNEFRVWPRRSQSLECVLFQPRSGPTHEQVELARFRFPNPAPAQPAGWPPQPLPATQPAGDLQITLHAFVAGAGSSVTHRLHEGVRLCRYTGVKPGEEPRAAVQFTVDSPRGTNESWSIAQLFLSDATGNNLKATSWSHGVGRPAHFSPVFWPGETAWKLTARFKRSSGLPASDLLVFESVPLPGVGQTNHVHLTNHVNGIECVLHSIVVRPPLGNRSSYGGNDLTVIRLQYQPLPENVVVDLLGVTFDDPTVQTESAGSSWSHSYHESQFSRFPTQQTHATITYAVQPMREVEFLVPPNWIAPTQTVELRASE